jgi:hypothetical protein
MALLWGKRSPVCPVFFKLAYEAGKLGTIKKPAKAAADYWALK